MKRVAGMNECQITEECTKEANNLIVLQTIIEVYTNGETNEKRCPALPAFQGHQKNTRKVIKKRAIDNTGQYRNFSLKFSSTPSIASFFAIKTELTAT